MANKIVIIPKRKDTGVEYPLDVDTGTNLRDLCSDDNNGFWVILDTVGSTQLVQRYRIDAANVSAKKLTDSASVGNASGIFGIAKSKFNLYVASHNLRAGTHTNTITELRIATTGPIATGGSISIDSSGADNGNRFRGLDWQNERLITIYNVAVANSNRRIYRAFPSGQFTENASSGHTTVSGICAEADGTYWTIGSDNILRRYTETNIELTDEAITLTHSGTARGICQAGMDRLAISMN